MATIYDSFGDPGRKNPAKIPINKMKLDSRILEINVESIPKSSTDYLEKSYLLDCKPDLKLMLRRPLRITFELKSGINANEKQQNRIKDGSRKLQFHGGDPPKEIQSR